MTRSTLLGATALVLSATLAAPAMAKDMKTDHAKKEMRMAPQKRMHSGHMARRDNMSHDNMARQDGRMAYRQNGDMAYRNDRSGWNNNDDWAWNDNRRDSGFWPADAAAGVVGGAVATAGAAVNTAGAIATAPFRDDPYARNNDYAYNNGYSTDNDNWAWNDDRADTGFWPADTAANVVGGAVNTAGAAVNTAGAIATAPFRSNSYAYYNGNNGWDNNGWNNGWNGQTYAQRNGFVCQPGTWFKGADGRRHICQ